MIIHMILCPTLNLSEFYFGANYVSAGKMKKIFCAAKEFFPKGKKCNMFIIMENKRYPEPAI